METGEIILVAFLAAFAAGGAAFAVYAYMGRGPSDTVFLACLRAAATIYGRVFHGVKVPGREQDPFPASGAHILVSNHLSGVDPVILAVWTKRRIRFMMAREYYESPIVHAMVSRIGCIPVNRDGNDLGATKAALKALREGEVIGIFPQGGIREAGGSLEGKSGVALLALKTGAPVVPFRVEGSPNVHSVLRAILTPSRMTIRHGPPMRFEAQGDGKPSRQELEEITTRILDAIDALGDPGVTGREEPPAPGGEAKAGSASQGGQGQLFDVGIPPR